MVDSKRADDWYAKADADIRGAKILFEHDGGYDLVTFLCQQAIEKALKGWLLKHTEELFEGHSLVFLCRTAIRNGAKLSDCLKDCAYVNQYYIETRYPADAPLNVTQEEAQECIDIANKVIERLG